MELTSFTDGFLTWVVENWRSLGHWNVLCPWNHQPPHRDSPFSQHSRRSFLCFVSQTRSQSSEPEAGLHQGQAPCVHTLFLSPACGKLWFHHLFLHGPWAKAGFYIFKWWKTLKKTMQPVKSYKTQISVSPQVSLEHSQIHCLHFVCGFPATMAVSGQWPYGPWSLKCLLSGPLQRKILTFADKDSIWAPTGGVWPVGHGS